jgi:hypothetical protein
MAENKTRATAASVDDFLDRVADPQRREDAKTVRALMERVSGEPAAMWGPSIVGFGSYHYKYESGREGDSCRIGFSPRSKELVLYLMGVFPARQALLEKLGRHKAGKGCLYIKRLGDIDAAVLEALVGASVDYMRETYPG